MTKEDMRALARKSRDEAVAKLREQGMPEQEIDSIIVLASQLGPEFNYHVQEFINKLQKFKTISESVGLTPATLDQRRILSGLLFFMLKLHNDFCANVSVVEEEEVRKDLLKEKENRHG